MITPLLEQLATQPLQLVEKLENVQGLKDAQARYSNAVTQVENCGQIYIKKKLQGNGKACKLLTLSSEVVMSTCGRSAEFSKWEIYIYINSIWPHKYD